MHIVTKTLIFSLLVLTGNGFFAQGGIKVSSSVCSYYGESFAEAKFLESFDDEAKRIIRSIIEVIGLRPRFEIRAAQIPNAAAVIYNSQRYVLYNPEFINTLNKRTGSNWASVSILAHEIGHHLNGHTLGQGGSRPDIELEADEFSGFVLNKLGATVEQAQAAMRLAADVKGSHTHPPRSERLVAIERGWQNASGSKSRPADPNIKLPEVREDPEKSEVLAEKFIASDVYFSADPQGKYHVTIRNNLVKLADDRLYVIGRLAASNRKGFSRMFYDDHYNYLYITARGKIVNGAGQAVGTIRTHRQAPDSNVN